jgi:hypothetical protein
MCLAMRDLIPECVYDLQFAIQSGGEDSQLALSRYKFRIGGHNLGDHVLRRGESAIHRAGKDDWKNGGQTITGI